MINEYVVNNMLERIEREIKYVNDNFDFTSIYQTVYQFKIEGMLEMLNMCLHGYIYLVRFDSNSKKLQLEKVLL